MAALATFMIDVIAIWLLLLLFRWMGAHRVGAQFGKSRGVDKKNLIAIVLDSDPLLGTMDFDECLSAFTTARSTTQ